MSKVLVINDDQNASRMLELLLARDGYDIQVENDGVGVLAKAESFDPDLILLDLMMPLIDGFEICRILRADSRFNHTAILILTALGDLDTQLNVFQAGADGFLQIPFHPTELRLKMGALLGKARELNG